MSSLRRTQRAGRHVRPFAALLPLLWLLAGCGGRPAQLPPPEDAIAPLREPELISLAERVAERLVELAQAAPTDEPLILSYPATTTGPNAVSPDLVEALVNAIHDRVGGAVRFAEPDAPLTTRRTAVHLHPATDDGPAELEFIGTDSMTRDEFAHEVIALAGARSTRARPARAASSGPGRAGLGGPPGTAPDGPAGEPEQPATADGPPAESVPWRPVKLNVSERALAAWLVEQWPNLKERTIRSKAGDAVVFADRRTRDMLTVRAQRATRYDGRLRVEVDAKGREHDRRVAVRVLFLDADRRVAETTPALPYHLLGEYTSTIAVTAGGAAAVHYVVVIQSIERADASER